jgi:hypothetical protein
MVKMWLAPKFEESRLKNLFTIMKIKMTETLLE